MFRIKHRFESHLRLLTVNQLASVSVPQSHPAVLTSCVEEGGVGEQSSVNPRHVSINSVLCLHASVPPVFEADQAALVASVGGKVDGPDDGGAVVAGGGDGGGGRAVSEAQYHSIVTLQRPKYYIP